MSVENFTHAEQWYYDHNHPYHCAVRGILRERGLPVRLAYAGGDGGPYGISAYMMSRGLATGHAPGRVRKQGRKSDRTYDRELEEIYA